MKKRLFAIVACVVLVAVIGICFAACNHKNDYNELEMPAYEDLEVPDYSDLQIPKDFKFGAICLHGEESTYDKNFIDAIKKAITDLGLSVKDNLILKTNIAETTACYTAARDLADQGCKVIFADSFGHEPFMVQAANEFPNVQFCHATGTNAHNEKYKDSTGNVDETTTIPSNFHNAFASIYEGRYLAGVVAGMKLKDMIDNNQIKDNQKDANGNVKVGYVGAFTYAEVISGYTSWFLGVRSVVPNTVMEVSFTGSWYDVTREKTSAEYLINKGCALISQHADSMGAPSACEEAGVPNVSYNGSTIEACPETFLVSSRIDWTPYIKYIIAQTVKKEAIDDDWLGTIATGSVVLTNLNADTVAEGTLKKIVELRKQLAEGTLHVFDTETFTVGNEKVTSHMFEGKEVVKDGYFHESEEISAPYFDLRIDGITLANEIYEATDNWSPNKK